MVQQTDVNESTACAGGESRLKGVSKTKETLSLFSTAIPIIGFVGTIFVWLAANFYTGAVDVQTPGQYKEIVIKVYDRKGQESVYVTPQFQLMPGKYHLTVTVDKNDPQQIDTEIALGKTSSIKVTTPISTASTPASTDDASGASSSPQTVRKHWWQFWKKSPADTDAN